MMLLHIDADRRGASLISVPRDAWVPIPGHGMGKVNWAYSFGGPALAVATFEKLTSIRVDHLVVVDWDGFMSLTDAVGGVDVDVPTTVYDSARHLTWTAGRHHLDGTQALAYVRERYGLPGGDLDRVRRQQAFLRALMQASLHQEMRKDPVLLYQFLNEVTRHVLVDDQWRISDLAALAASLRDLRSANIRYLTAPVAGLGREGDQSVVHLATDRDRDLWRAVHEDRMDQWSAINWNLLTPDVVN
jgi:LCP family protein required for cell wall assembly